MTTQDPTTRFDDRAADYAKARPGYPDAIVALLRDECGLRDGTRVADLGSGTGIFTRLLLDAGAEVFAVEPNDEMRSVSERQLGDRARFHSVNGRSEATTLPTESVELVTAAQAFHWFDIERTRREMRRVLRPEGQAVLVWNDRDTGGTAFHRAIEALLVEQCPSYRALQGKADVPTAFDAVFGPDGWSRRFLPNEQELDREGFVARFMSTSYAPKPATAAAAAFVRALETIFDAHADPAGVVRITYATVVVWGRPSAA